MPSVSRGRGRRRGRSSFWVRFAACLTLVSLAAGAALLIDQRSPLVARSPLSSALEGFFPGWLGAAELLTLFVATWLASIVAWLLAARWVRRRMAIARRLAVLQTLTPFQFEAWTGERFQERGFQVRHVGGQGDHGVDLFVERGSERAVVQCKKYLDWTVGEPTLRDLYGAMHAAGSNHAYVVTTGYFTRPARAWARGKPLSLWDGDTVAELAPSQVSFSGQPPETDPSPDCPACGSPMLVRHSRETGEPFLGCMNFPECRQTRPVVA